MTDIVEDTELLTGIAQGMRAEEVVCAPLGAVYVYPEDDCVCGSPLDDEDSHCRVCLMCTGTPHANNCTIND
jgi:hypothetical protein